jgi:hypothetical protein
MALKTETRSGLITTAGVAARLLLCHSCKQRKGGVFDLDPNGNPRCPDCQMEQNGKKA